MPPKPSTRAATTPGPQKPLGSRSTVGASAVGDASPNPSKTGNAQPRSAATVRSAKSAEPTTPTASKRIAGKSPSIAAASPSTPAGGKKKAKKDPNFPTHNLSFGHPPASGDALYADAAQGEGAEHDVHSPVASVCPTLALYGEVAAQTEPHDNAQTTSALFTIGWMYYFGLGGCKTSKKKAYAYYYAAAARGDPLAEYYVGLQQLRGDGTRKDPSAALEHFLSSAAGGVDVAAYAAGKLLLDGFPAAVEPNRERGIELLEQAERLNNVPAINKLAALRLEARSAGAAEAAQNGEK